MMDRREALWSMLYHLSVLALVGGSSASRRQAANAATVPAAPVASAYDDFVRSIYPKDATSKRYEYDENALSVYKRYDLSADETELLYRFESMGTLLNKISDPQLRIEAEKVFPGALEDDFTGRAYDLNINDAKQGQAARSICPRNVERNAGPHYPDPKAAIYELTDRANQKVSSLDQGKSYDLRLVGQGLSLGQGSSPIVEIHKLFDPMSPRPTPVATGSLASVAGTYRCGVIDFTVTVPQSGEYYIYVVQEIEAAQAKTTVLLNHGPITVT